MAEIEEDFYKPTEYRLDDYAGEVSKWEAGSPYLGLADVMTPEQDPAYQERLKRSAKANAFGSVLSTLMDTAVAGTGGMVEKSGEMPSQLRNLEEYNQERARVLTEGRQLKAAQLQDKLNQVRHQVEESRLKRDATARGQLSKADADWRGREAVRSDAARVAEQQELTKRAKDIANINAASDRYRVDKSLEATKLREDNRSTGATGKKYSVYDGEKEYVYTPAQMVYMYQKLANKIKDNPDAYGDMEGSFMIPLMDSYNEADLDVMQKTLSKYFKKDPELYNEFLRISGSGFNPGGGPLSPEAMKQNQVAESIVAPDEYGVTDLSGFGW